MSNTSSDEGCGLIIILFILVLTLAYGVETYFELARDRVYIENGYHQVDGEWIK